MFQNIEPGAYYSGNSFSARLAIKKSGMSKSIYWEYFYRLFLASFVVNLIIFFIFIEKLNPWLEYVNVFINLILLWLIIMIYIDSYKKMYLNTSNYNYIGVGLILLSNIIMLSILNGPITLIFGF